MNEKMEYDVYVCGQKVATVVAEAGWSRGVGISSEEQLKRDYVKVIRKPSTSNIPVIYLK